MGLDVVISVAGKGLLGQSWARYRIGSHSVCATTPIIPILIDVLSRSERGDGGGEGGDSDVGRSATTPYLVVLLPYSLITALGSLTWDDLEDYSRQGYVGEMERRLNEYFLDVLKSVEGSFRGSKIYRNVFDRSNSDLSGGLLNRLEETLEGLKPGVPLEEGGRLILVPVQVSGTFPLKYERMSSSTGRKVSYVPLSMEGSLLDPFIRVYATLKEIWARNRSENTRMRVHFDSSSGMNAVTLSALLGARAFTGVYGQELHLYSTDPYSVELTDHCGKVILTSRREEISSPTSGMPLRVSDAGRLLYTFELVEDISSLIGMMGGGSIRIRAPGGPWSMLEALEDDADRERLEVPGSPRSLLEDARNDLSYLKNISEGEIEVNQAVDLLKRFLGSLRRISCGFREVIVSYAHKELADSLDVVGEIYGRGGMYDLIRRELRTRMYPAPGGRLEEMVIVDGRPRGGVGLGIGFSWVTGPTFVLLDAAASVLSRTFRDLNIIEEVTDFRLRGPFSVKQLDRGVTADFLLSMAIYFSREGLSLNLSFLLAELGLKEEGIELLATLNEGDEEGTREARTRFDKALRDFVENFRKRSKKQSGSEEGEEGGLIADLRILAEKVGSIKRVKGVETIDLLRLYFLNNWLRFKSDYFDELVRMDGRCGAGISISTILKELRSGGVESFIGRFGPTLGETLQCLLEFLTRKDVYDFINSLYRLEKIEKQEKIGISPRFLNFLKAMAIVVHENPENVIGEEGIMEVMRHLRAHLGLTHFAVRNILSNQGSELEILYDRTLFERLNELGRKRSGLRFFSSLCDVGIRSDESQRRESQQGVP